MNRLSFPYGDTEMQISIPPGLEVRFLAPFQAEPAPEPAREIRRALQEPIGSEPLSILAAGKKSAVIVVSDSTRLSPSGLFLPFLLAEVGKGGIKKEDTTVVVATGAHRRATEEEIKSIVGAESYSKIKCVSSSPDPEACVVLGKTSRGTPVQIFREVALAGLIIATGNLEPHRMASFSGGAKALVPGTSGLEAIEMNHALSMKGKPGKDPGQSEVRADAEEAATLAGLDFIFNVVVDHRGRLIKAYAGHPVKAHREGCKLAGKIYCVPGCQPADIVLASAGGFPKDQSLYQAIKSLQNASAVVKPGGTVILAARCREGFSNKTFQSWAEAGLSEPETLERFSRGFVLGGHKAAYAARITEKCRVYLVSGLARETVELLHFHPCRNLQEAFDAALARFGKAAPEVVAMPYAGLTFPDFEEPPGACYEGSTSS